MICDKFVELTEEELSKIKNGYNVYKICRDVKLIEKEMERTNTPYIEELELSQEYIDDLVSCHFCYEMTEHYYDSSPDECEECD